MKILQILLFFMQGFPETVGVCAFSLALARVQLRWGVILPTALVMTAIILVLRSIPITFGLHTVATILLWTLFIVRATRVPPSQSFMVVFAGIAAVALLELTMFKVLVRLLNIDINKFMSDVFLWKLAALPQAIMMIVFALLISKYRKPLEGMWRI
ncbi:hypothetical protein DCCM_0368 [Desulfocucumis palustris]|uniref:Uncharacterized protein n=1 Tax=Desulfocucumis palustris TaxID=1898651 RepID=A0A2L2X7K7_9FIRM|nr:hypothetical protein [Desulfocucumis palustris]GBF32177.1 hypothetical protein DCCM_0368 [Desulfocucumis palustris]